MAFYILPQNKTTFKTHRSSWACLKDSITQIIKEGQISSKDKMIQIEWNMRQGNILSRKLLTLVKSFCTNPQGCLWISCCKNLTNSVRIKEINVDKTKFLISVESFTYYVYCNLEHVWISFSNLFYKIRYTSWSVFESFSLK